MKWRRKGRDSKGNRRSEKGQVGDLDIQQEDFIKDVMVLVFHDWAGSEKRLEV